MANTKSALKRIRQTETRTARNRAVSSKLKTLRKKIATAVETSDKEAAAVAYNTFSSAVDKAAKVGTIPANRAANYKSQGHRKNRLSFHFGFLTIFMASRSVLLSGLFYFPLPCSNPAWIKPN